MSTFIQGLRAKPEHTRKKIAFFSALGVTLIIFLFWLGSVTGVNSSAANSASSTISAAVSNAAPLQTISAGVTSVVSDIKDIFFSPKKVTYSTLEVTPGK